jgi:hypothetical protein
MLWKVLLPYSDKALLVSFRCDVRCLKESDYIKRASFEMGKVSLTMQRK